ncbi:hypothetical protein ACLOJK_019113, partial [Asimina triloba]
MAMVAIRRQRASGSRQAMAEAVAGIGVRHSGSRPWRWADGSDGGGGRAGGAAVPPSGNRWAVQAVQWTLDQPCGMMNGLDHPIQALLMMETKTEAFEENGRSEMGDDRSGMKMNLLMTGEEDLPRVATVINGGRNGRRRQRFAVAAMAAALRGFVRRVEHRRCSTMVYRG